MSFRVVVLLMRMNDALHRHIGEQRIPPAQDQGLPQAAHPAVTVVERVDKLKLVGQERVPDLLDLARRRNHRLASQDRADLLLAQGVALDRQ